MRISHSGLVGSNYAELTDLRALALNEGLIPRAINEDGLGKWCKTTSENDDLVKREIWTRTMRGM